MATQWSEVNHKVSAERRAEIKKASLRDYAAARTGLARLRLYRNETQVNVAEHLDVPQSAVSRMERGENPQLKTLQRYVEALGGQLEITAVFPDDRVDISLLMDGAAADVPKTPSLAVIPGKRLQRTAVPVKIAAVKRARAAAMRRA